MDIAIAFVQKIPVKVVEISRCCISRLDEQVSEFVNGEFEQFFCVGHDI